jgi:integrase
VPRRASKAEPALTPGHGGTQRSRLDAQVSAVTVAKAYRLLKAIFNTAVDDGLIRRNPCRIKGPGQEKSPERPVLTVPQVYALADAVGGRYRALVLLGVFGSLRRDELAALRRSDIDFQARTVRKDSDPHVLRPGWSDGRLDTPMPGPGFPVPAVAENAVREGARQGVHGSSRESHLRRVQAHGWRRVILRKTVH